MKINSNLLFSLIFSFVLVGSISLAFYSYTQFTLLNPKIESKATQEVLGDQEILENLTPTNWISRINKIILLPQGENPRVIFLTGVDKLKDPFFTNAREGDILLIYDKIKKAILYNPKENRVIEVGVLGIQQNIPKSTPKRLELPPSSSPSATPS